MYELSLCRKESGQLTALECLVECRVFAYMTVNLERLINHTGVLEDLCPKYLDLVLFVRVIGRVHRVEEGLAV